MEAVQDGIPDVIVLAVTAIDCIAFPDSIYNVMLIV